VCHDMSCYLPLVQRWRKPPTPQNPTKEQPKKAAARQQEETPTGLEPDMPTEVEARRDNRGVTLSQKVGDVTLHIRHDNPHSDSVMLPTSVCIKSTLGRRRVGTTQVSRCLWESQAFDWLQSCEVLQEAVRARRRDEEGSWRCRSSTRRWRAARPPSASRSL